MTDKKNEVSITIHGLDVDNGAVRGDVLVRKLKALISSLKESEKFANDKKVFDYFVSDLRMGSAYAKFKEKRTTKNNASDSGVSIFSSAMKKIYNADPSISKFPKSLISNIRNLTTGAGKEFSHAEVAYNTKEKIVRIDDFLQKRADEAYRIVNGAEAQKEKFYRGIAYGSFDGVLKEIDARGTLVRGKIILTAGAVEIDCVMNTEDIPTIRECFNIRTVIEGAAHYDGETQLPIRIDVKSIKPVKHDADMLQWKGAFKPNKNHDLDW